MKKTRHIIIGAVGLVLVFMTGMVMAENVQTQKISRAVIKIDSLSRGECFSTINAGLSSLEGYSGMGANMFRKLIAIDFAAPLTPEKISQTLLEVGYPGKLETVDIISKKESFAYLEYRRTGVASNGGGCCSVGGPPAKNSNASQNSNTSQGSPSLIPPSGGSCCSLPASSQTTENL